MAKRGKEQEVELTKLKPYEKNAKIHSPGQVQKIADSIQEFGFLNACLIDKDYNIIAGHGRVEAAKLLGMETVPCTFIEGLTEEQRKAYILADNKLTELGDWDFETVSNELEELKESGFDISVTGFDIDDIIITDEMGADVTKEEIEEMAKAEPRIKRGEVWVLGRHRLMCGDSTDPQDVEKLMGGGTADLLMTDPPYGINYEGTAGTIENDNLQNEEFIQFLVKAFEAADRVMKPGAAFYIWYGSSRSDCFFEAAKKSGMTIREILVWVKNMFTLGRQDYQWRHEPCLYGWKDGAPHYFIDLRSLTTVQEGLEPTREELEKFYKSFLEYTTTQYEDKPLKNDLHPTMKPIPLFERLIRNSSREKEIVLDLFGGSGTTMIACEEMNRDCRMMEYDPHYAEVIIQRWEELTGEKAVKL